MSHTSCVRCREESEIIEGEVVDVQIDRPSTVCTLVINLESSLVLLSHRFARAVARSLRL